MASQTDREAEQQAEVDAIWSKTWPGRAGLPIDDYSLWQVIKFVWQAAWLGYYG